MNPLRQAPSFDDAIILAARAHYGQTDRAGEPYILHVLRVALKQSDPTTRVVALLHDVVEDTAISLNDLHEFGYGDEVVAAIACITRNEAEVYDEYIERVLTNRVACRVKLADLEDNMEPAPPLLCQ